MSETRQFLESLVAHVEDDAGNMVFASFGEGLKAQVWSMPPSRVPEMGPKVCTDWNAEQGRNVYWSAGLRRQDLSPAQRGSAADVTAMLAIVVDLDDEEAAAGYEAKIAACPGLKPTAVVRTSFTPTPRYQLVYLLHEPTSDFDHWRRAARCVEAYFEADHCSKDLAHVWRVPGTVNFPNATKQSRGRVAEGTTLVHFDANRRFELADFTDNLPEPEAEVELPAEVTSGRINDLVMSYPWRDWEDIAGNLPEWMQDDMFRPLPGRHKDRSTFDWQVAKECAREGLQMGDYIALYRLAAQEEFAAKWREKEMNRPGSGDEYLARTYAKAKIAAEKEGPLPEKPDLRWLDGRGAYVPDEAQGEAEIEVEVPASEQFNWIDAVRTCKQIRNLPEEEVEYLIFPWLQKGAIHCVHGPSGAGKSFFLAHQLFGLARGKGIGPFGVKAPEKVLYIDCEMGGRTIRSRMRGLERSYGLDEEGRFMVWSPFFAPRGAMPYVDLFDREVWQRIGLMVQALDPEVIVIDNARSCTDDLVENDAEGWKKLNRFWTWLREAIGRERTVVWVHHDNKAKEGRTYAGNTAAITVTEVVVPLSALPDDKVDGMARMEEARSGGEYTVRHAVVMDLTNAKNREKDTKLHRKWTLMYRQCREDGVTKMAEWNEGSDLSNLSDQERAWAMVRKMGQSFKQAADALRTSKSTAERWVKSLDGQEETLKKIERRLAGRLD